MDNTLGYELRRVRFPSGCNRMVRISRSTRTNLRIIVNSRSKSFERLEQKQGTEMQVYISGESPDGKRSFRVDAEVGESGLTVNQFVK